MIDFWGTDLAWAVIISAVFLLIFLLAEITRKRGVCAEGTRKLVHFGGAFVTIFFPFILKSHWTVLALAIAFGLIMFLTKKFGLLQSVHGVERKSDGAIYHPIAIYTCFLYSQILNQPWFYVIAITILAVSDALAAIVGKNYGANEYIVEVGLRKTIEGSVTFFLTSFLIIHLILLLATPTGRLESVLIALLISIIVTVFEGVSLKGADNLFIPLATIFILSKNINPTVYGISFQIGILTAFLAGYLLIMRPYKRIGFSGITLLGLINYVVWALLGNVCAAILFIFAFICAKTDLILNYDCEFSDSFRVRNVFYILTIPLVCAFLENVLNNHVYFPFITSIICEGVLIRTRLYDVEKGLILTLIISLIALGVSYVFIG